MVNQYANSQRLLSLFLAFLVTFVCFVGLIPSVHAADKLDPIILTSEPYQTVSFSSDAIPLYVDENTPLTFQYLLDHPEYTLHIGTTSTTVRWSFKLGGMALNSYKGWYGSQAVDGDWYLAEKTSNMTNGVNSHLYLCNYDSSYSVSYTVWCEVDLPPVVPYEDVLNTVGVVTNVTLDSFGELLSFIQSHDLLMIIFSVVLLSILLGFVFLIKSRM